MHDHEHPLHTAPPPPQRKTINTPLAAPYITPHPSCKSPPNPPPPLQRHEKLFWWDSEDVFRGTFQHVPKNCSMLGFLTQFCFEAQPTISNKLQIRKEAKEASFRSLLGSRGSSRKYFRTRAAPRMGSPGPTLAGKLHAAPSRPALPLDA